MLLVFNALGQNVDKSPESGLDRQLIAEHLLSKGYRMSDLRNLPEEQRKALMREACVYAALRLANIEAKSKFSQKIKAP